MFLVSARLSETHPRLYILLYCYIEVLDLRVTFYVTRRSRTMDTHTCYVLRVTFVALMALFIRPQIIDR